MNDCENILIAGAGGGFDIFAGLPIFRALKDMGKNVILANLSFSFLGDQERVDELGLFRIGPDSKSHQNYFPEGVLARYLESMGFDNIIYAFNKSGVQPVLRSYEYLVDKYDIDAVVLIDGGTDILMRGDESGLGTPTEDMVSLAAVNLLDVKNRFVFCLGFGVDTYHGVCHSHFLENVSALSKKGGFIGSQSLLEHMPEVKFYLDAVRYSEKNMPTFSSIVNTSIASAIEGQFGDYHRTERTRSSELYINPLMSMYWGFDLAVLADHSLYLDRLRTTESIWDVNIVIESFRSELETQRVKRTIPH